MFYILFCVIFKKKDFKICHQCSHAIKVVERSFLEAGTYVLNNDKKTKHVTLIIKQYRFFSFQP